MGALAQGTSVLNVAMCAYARNSTVAKHTIAGLSLA
jgi:hypothetical protein